MAMTRVDPYVDLQLSHPDAHALPSPGTMKDFSVRWTGFLTPAESGAYELGADGFDGSGLWLDGKLIVDDWTSGTIRSAAGDG